MSDTRSPSDPNPPAVRPDNKVVPADPASSSKAEGRPLPDPTRYGDWEKNGRCIDF